MPNPPNPKRRRPLPWWLHFAMAVVLIALVQAFAVKLGRIPSGSMEQTLRPGQVIAIDRVTVRWNPVGAGEVVVFVADETWLGHPQAGVDSPIAAARWAVGVLGYGTGLQKFLVKRIIAVAGDTVSCCDAQGRVLVNGSPLSEPYIFEDYPFTLGTLDCSSGSLRCFPSVTVPPNSLFVLGDHRSNSADSIFYCRIGQAPPCAKFVNRTDVMGRVIGVGRG